jgi:tellurite methyltransferase
MDKRIDGGVSMVNHPKNTHRPAQFLVENAGLLPKGRALDVAMGGGRNAIFLAKLGFEVDGVDGSHEAVRRAMEWAEESGVHLNVQVADLEADYHIDPGGYDVIICFNYLQRSLIPRIKAGVRTGGMVVYETFILEQGRFGKPANPHYLLKHNELLDMFREFRCLRYREGIIDRRKAIASILAEKVKQVGSTPGGVFS